MKRAALVRHFPNEEEKGDEGGLTVRGQEQGRELVRQLVAAGIIPDLILHSPLLRAKQTAELIVAEYVIAGHVMVRVPVRRSNHLRTQPAKKISNSVLADPENMPLAALANQFRYAADDFSESPEGNIGFALEQLDQSGADYKNIMLISHKPEILAAVEHLVFTREKDFQHGQAAVFTSTREGSWGEFYSPEWRLARRRSDFFSQFMPAFT